MQKQTNSPYGYKQLLVYKKAEELLFACTAFTSHFSHFAHSTLSSLSAFKTLSALADQMDRSARSVKQNIVEGWKRNSTKEYHQFLGFSLGANAELEEDCDDILKGAYEKMGLTGEKGRMGEIEKLPFYPLNPHLPPLVQLKLRGKELNFLLQKLQTSLSEKMSKELGVPLKDKILTAVHREEAFDRWIAAEREKLQREEREKGEKKGEKGFTKGRVLFFVALLVLGASAAFNIYRTLGHPAQVHAAYSITTSARLATSTADYLSKTFSTHVSTSSWTLSMWVKRGALSASSTLWSASTTAADDRILFGTDDKLYIYENGTNLLKSTEVFRDPAAWTHFVFVHDATSINNNATKFRVYKNNVEITSWDTDNRSALLMASSTKTSSGTTEHDIGRRLSTATDYFDGYISDVYFINSTTTPSSFGAADINGYWRPISYTGGYGTNGFKLDFGTGYNLGKDAAGSNNFATSSQMTVYSNQFIDTPTNSFATLNPLVPSGNGPLRSGNLMTLSSGTSTFFMSTGKWYWEVYATSTGVSAGVISATGVPSVTSVGNGLVMGFEFDADAGTLASTTDGSTFAGTVSGLTGGRFAHAAGGKSVFYFGQGGSSITTNTATTSFTTTGTTTWIAPPGVTSISYLVVAGGGGGASNGGGAGAGGMLTGTTNVTAGVSYTVTVGAGGTGAPTLADGTNGGNSSLTGTGVSLTAVGGGNGMYNVAGNGGSGGGGGFVGGAGGTGTVGQGNDGGAGLAGSPYGAGGGGGAGAVGGTAAGSQSGNGGAGLSSSITGSATFYAGGGGGGSTSQGSSAGSGGSSVGGAGSPDTSTASSGTANRGGGGGGGSNKIGGGSGGGNGGSGIVIVAYNAGSTVSPTYNTAAGGSFILTPPTNYKALNTNNMSAPSVTIPKNYFQAQGYYGTGIAMQVASSTNASSNAQKRIFLTSGTSFTVPGDWNNASNTVEAIGGGGSGSVDYYTNFRAAGGGGGGYAKVSNIVLNGGSATYQIGQGGASVNRNSSQGATAGLPGTDTLFNGSGTTCATNGGSVCAKGGSGGSAGTGGAGGVSTSGIGATVYSGGRGGNCINTPATGSNSSCGAGGAAGPGGAGGNGGDTGTGNTLTSGGTGGNGSGGAGATASTYPDGSAGGCSGGCTGRSGTEWDSSHGSGGGAASSGTTGSCGAAGGGSYGGGGGSCAVDRGLFDSPDFSGAGANGIVVLTYTPYYSISFQPDIVWIKDRTTANSHGIFDSVRSVYAWWSSNSGAAEIASSTAVTAIFNGGFTLAANTSSNNALTNKSGDNYVAWVWDKSPTSGVDIVTYQGTGATQSISHSLGKTPAMIIVKRRDGTGSPAVWHASYQNANMFQLLSTTAATSSDSTYWNGTQPNGSVFSVGTNANTNGSGSTYVAYLFATTTGFSDFGVYTGNSSTDGPFVYTGFKPKYVLIKNARTAGGDWELEDTARDPFNPTGAYLLPDTSGTEPATSARIDMLSNGFKLRVGCGTNLNCTGDQFIYAAFAEQPFASSSAAYNLSIASSTRFISGNSAFLSRTPTSAGNQKKWTFSTWVKKAGMGVGQTLFGAGTTFSAGSGRSLIFFDDTDHLDVQIGLNNDRISTDVFRDPATWLHVVVSVDTTQVAANERVKVYVNNRRITSFGTALNPDQDLATLANSTELQTIGKLSSHDIYYLNAYMSDAYMLDGTSTDPTSFGEYDASGYWRPKTYTGVFTGNSFYLKLQSTSTVASIGTDSSGRGNFFTSSGFKTYDSVTDSPTNSYTTLSPIDKAPTMSLAAGNLQASVPSGSTITYAVRATTGVSSGKWYWEATMTGSGAQRQGIGITSFVPVPSDTADNVYNSADTKFYYAPTGVKVSGGTQTAYGSSFTFGDVIGVALDMDNGLTTFYKNGVGQGTAFTGLTGVVAPVFMDWVPPSPGGTQGATFNFGQGATTSITGGQIVYDSASGGYFAYTPPSGFKALSTANMPAPTILKPSSYFNAVTYMGTSTATGATFTIGSSTAATFTRIFLTNTGAGQWTVPGDWNSASNTVETIGGGGGGATGVAGGNGGGGGGGGAYSLVRNISLLVGSTSAFSVGVGNTAGNAGGDTYFCNASSASCGSISGGSVVVGAQGGSTGAAPAGGAGGAASSGVGTTRKSGGTGGTSSSVASSGAGGGGAAGPNGAGASGGSTANVGAARSGGGGGGNGGGSVGASNTAGNVGGAGGNNSGGSGSGAGATASVACGAGTNGGGGGGGASDGVTAQAACAGGAGTEWDSTPHGSGGGGGGGPALNGATMTGGAGAVYGGGAGGGGATGSQTGTGGTGGNGIIVITYTSSPLGFSPDIIWIKDRTTAYSHAIFDTARIVYPSWASNNAQAEVGGASTTLTGFLSNGFMLGASSTYNTSGNNYISWLWKKATSTNGVDIVSYTGSGSDPQNISHSLGKRPAFVIVKRRDAAGTSGYVWSASMSGQTTFAVLDTNAATTTTSSPFSAFTGTTFAANTTLNTSGAMYTAYVFATSTGFSDFGTYYGNGSTDGPFVYTGFKPRWVMVKETNGGANWYVWDSARSAYNVIVAELQPNLTNAEANGTTDIDFLSNGFKLRNSADAGINGSGNQYIYAAFADIPFYYSAQTAASATVAAAAVSAVAFLMGMTF